jgi:toxin ParE1/3/4
MSEPILTDQAKADLEDIWVSIAEGRDERTAERVTARILSGCRTRARFPESGRLREELAPGLRSFVVKPYVVFYRPEAGTILVVRVVHGRRDIEQLLGE